MLFLRKFSSRTSGPFWAKNVKTCFFTYEAVHFMVKIRDGIKSKARFTSCIYNIFTNYLWRSLFSCNVLITGSHLCKHLRHHQLLVVSACNVKSFAFAVLVFFMFPSRPFDRLTKVFLGTFYHSLPRKRVTKTWLISWP